MARKRVAPFEPPTEYDAQQHPEQVRRGPKGGLMWKCAFCARVASHLAQTGNKVCNAHGGSTHAQRDPIERAKVIEAGHAPPRPPGRPVKHGFYTIIPGHNIDELVEQYRAQQMDADATDDDMYYLRAYLDEAKQLRPDARAVALALQDALSTVPAFLQQRTDLMNENGSGLALSVSQVMRLMNLYNEFNADLTELKGLLAALVGITKDVEGGHARLINLSKIRAETRLKNVAAAEMSAFATMLTGLQVILSETIPSEYLGVFQARVERELSEVAERAGISSVNA